EAVTAVAADLETVDVCAVAGRREVDVGRGPADSDPENAVAGDRKVDAGCGAARRLIEAGRVGIAVERQPLAVAACPHGNARADRRHAAARIRHDGRALRVLASLRDVEAAHAELGG